MKGALQQLDTIKINAPNFGLDIDDKELLTGPSNASSLNVESSEYRLLLLMSDRPTYEDMSSFSFQQSA